MHTARGFMDRIEETLIAIILGLMTVITFANVVWRKLLASNLLWGLETTVFLFAWLVLLGASYLVKTNAHLGVDAIIELVSPPVRRAMALFSVAVCIVFSFLMLKGAWDYWANFANLPQTSGRWFPTGFEEKFRPKGWYEVDDIGMPFFLDWMGNVFNDGEKYEKLPRMIPYAVLPLSMALLLFRYLQAAWRVWKGETDRIVASHELEDEVEEVNELLGETD